MPAHSGSLTRQPGRGKGQSVLVAGRKGLLGRDDQLVWQRYCGFLDLPIAEFMEIQEQLLREEVKLVANSFLGSQLLGGRLPSTSDEFVRTVPLTTYEDYAPYFKRRREDVLAEKPYCWAYTSERSGGYRWIPFTQRAFDRLIDSVMAGFILSCASEKDEVNLERGCRILHHLPSRPYLSGLVVFGMAEHFDLTSVLPLDQWESMDFHDKIAKGFEHALSSGVDIISCMSSVMAKMGQSFGSQSGGFRVSRYAAKPDILFRVAIAKLRARIAGRQMLPKDLWKVKSIVSWGPDSEIYREKIRRYWGVTPYELYACTEAGVIGMQSWRKGGIIPVPYAGFLEFMREEDSLRSRRDRAFMPETLLLNQVEQGQRYELVTTSFYGMPLLRYRLGHLVRVLSLKEEESGIEIPSLALEGRVDDVLDIGGFTRLGEKTISRALDATGIEYVDWSMTKECEDSREILHLYIELRDGGHDALADALHGTLVANDPFYNDLDKMLQMKPLKVTILSSGTFRRYADKKRSEGKPPEFWTPTRTNPSAIEVSELLNLSHN